MTSGAGREGSSWHNHLLVLIVLVALGLRVHRLGAASLWIDEFNSLFASTGRATPDVIPHVAGRIDSAASVLTSLEGAPPWWNAWKPSHGSRHGNPHPPLYALAQRLWREAFGDSEVALRSLSVVASIVALLLVYDIGRVRHGPTVGLWAAFLMAVAPFQVLYAQEARGYALALAFVVASAASLVRIETRGASLPRLVTLGGCTLAAAFSHYFAIGALAASGCYALLRLPPRSRNRVLGTLVLAGLLFVAAWGPFFYFLHGHAAQGFPAYVEPRTGHLSRTVHRLAAGPIVHLVGNRMESAPSPWAWLVIAATLPLVRRRDLTLWLLWEAGALGLVASHDLLNATKQLGIIRFTLFASPATYLLVASACADRGRRLRHAVPALASAAALANLGPAYDQSWKPAWRELGQAVDLLVQRDDVLILDHPHRTYMLRALAYYADLGRSFVVVPGSDLPESVRTEMADRRGAWLVAAAPSSVRRLPTWEVAELVFDAGPGGPALWRLRRRSAPAAVRRWTGPGSVSEVAPRERPD